MPSWTSATAGTLVADLLITVDDDGLLPCASTPEQHTWLHNVQRAGRLAEEKTRAGNVDGLPYHAPFLDQAVIEACLATVPQDARDPHAYKPLLGAAMIGVLPAEIRARTSKDHCLPEWQAGLRAQRRVLARWCDTSRLADLGLVDPAALRRVALNPELLGTELAALEKTIATEAWLRDLEEHPWPCA